MPKATRPADGEARADEAAGGRPSPDAVIRTRILTSLGLPPGLYRVNVLPIWDGHYRVNVLIGPDAASVRVAHSYFVEAGDDGAIISAVASARPTVPLRTTAPCWSGAFPARRLTPQNGTPVNDSKHTFGDAKQKLVAGGQQFQTDRDLFLKFAAAVAARTQDIPTLQIEPRYVGPSWQSYPTAFRPEGETSTKSRVRESSATYVTLPRACRRESNRPVGGGL
jgi:hypothetical protein